jgi:cytochrome c peroxidase
VSPSKWETFAYDWLPRQAELPASFPTAFPAVARAWTSWAGRRANLSDRARGELAAALDEILADPAVRSMLART